MRAIGEQYVKTNLASSGFIITNLRIMWEAGQVIKERYQLREKFGSNTGRETWLAQDLESETSELVIVKLLTFGGNIQWADVRLFEREAQILQQLNHERIPKYKNYFSIDDSNLGFGLVEEYISGNSLKQLLEQGTRFGEAEIINIAQEILQILVYLHSFNPPILHRDIKPSNLLLGDDNKIYLVDFGAVQDSFAYEGAATFTIVGTYGYAPLEQFGGQTVPASDLYALGITIIHLLTRTVPSNLPNKDLKIQFRERVTVSPRLANWLDKMIAPAVERRFTTAISALRWLPNKDLKTQFRERVVPGLPDRVTVSSKLSNWLDKKIAPAVERHFTTIITSLRYLLPEISLELAPLGINNSDFKLAEITTSNQSNKPVYSNIKIKKDADFIEIIIPKQGFIKLDNFIKKFLSKLVNRFHIFILLLIVGGIIFLSMNPLTAILTLIILLLFDSDFRNLFITTTICCNRQEFSRKQFSIVKHFSIIDNVWGFSRIYKGITSAIDDVSIHHVSRNINPNNLKIDSLIINTKYTSKLHSKNTYLIGKNLSEVELLWLAQELRNWLNNNEQIPDNINDLAKKLDYTSTFVIYLSSFIIRFAGRNS